jgi:beta-mannosidase
MRYYWILKLLCIVACLALLRRTCSSFREFTFARRSTGVRLVDSSLWPSNNEVALKYPSSKGSGSGFLRIGVRRELPRWHVTNSRNVSFGAYKSGPFSIHSILHENGIIDDPLSGWNELDLAWISADTWTVETSFGWDGAEACLEASHVDTIAEVSIDGFRVLNTSNMFLKHVVKLGALSGGIHRISVVFRPAVMYTELKFDALTFSQPHTEYWIQQGHYNMIRKRPVDFGWDFAPSFVPSGLLGSLQIVSCRSSIENVVVEQRHDWAEEAVYLTPKIMVRSVEDLSRERFSVRVIDPLGRTVGESYTESSDCRRVLTHLWRCDLGRNVRVSKPFLWYTWDQGNQPMYNIVVSMVSIVAEYSVRVALREVRLVRESLDNGESFFVELNRRMIYAKGANVVPLSIFGDQYRVEDVDDLLYSARNSNMNMLRVWGGGEYLPNVFYERCDDLGIIIWQELVMACATYPDEIQSTLSVEIHEQLARLANRVALWGLNNEDENSFDWFIDTRKNRRAYQQQYENQVVAMMGIFRSVVGPRVQLVDSSPSNGIESSDPFVKRWGDVSDPLYGDIHFYSYDKNLLDDSVYPAPCFVSEFGFPSLPWLITEDDSMDGQRLGEYVRFRTRREMGFDDISRQLHMHFLNTTLTIGDIISRDVLMHVVYLSQVQQFLIYERSAAVWRASLTRKHTLGSLFWQLNDIDSRWAGTSWSIMNKIVHFAVREAFAPIAAVVRQKEGHLSIYVSNHHHHSENVKLQVHLMPYNAKYSRDVTWICRKEALIRGGASIRLCSIELSKATRKTSALVISLETTEGTSLKIHMPSEAKEASHISVPRRLKILEIAQTAQRAQTVGTAEQHCRHYEAVLSSDVVSLFVTLHTSLPGIEFSENAVTVVPWTNRSVRFSRCARNHDDVDPSERDFSIFDLASSMVALA